MPNHAAETVEPHSPPVARLDDADRAALERMRRINPRANPQERLPDVRPSRLPRHVAIIMDGNGRWAEQRGFPRIFGHRNGAAAVRETIAECGRLGIEALTLFSFSSENWKRPSDEIEALMRLCVMYLEGERDALIRENLRLRVIGRREGLPDEVVRAIEAVEAATANLTGPTLCLAINYGSRAEIIDATRALARRVRSGDIDPADIDEAAFEAELGTAGLPEPDLLIRTAGELRLSNFLLWQLSYAEIYVADVFWPDFDTARFHAAIREYARRGRRFGGLAHGPAPD